MVGWTWGGTDEQESIGTIHSAIDRGITLIDTAPVFGFGKSEEIAGKALASGGLRQRVSIAPAMETRRTNVLDRRTARG